MIGLARLVTGAGGGHGPSLNFNFVDGSAFSPQITFTRASTATYFDATGTLQSAAINVPRFDYDPATLAARGFLIEEQRTNLLTYSEAFDNAAWTQSNSSITSNTIVAPDGTLTGDKIVEDSANSSHWVYRNPSFTSGTSYTASVFAKAAERTQVHVQLGGTSAFGDLTWAIFDLSTQTVVASNNSPTTSISAVGNGWFRLTVSKTATATGSPQLQIGLASGGTAIYTGDGTSGAYVWGAQLEAGSFPTSYIPTTTTALTRSADVASVNTLSPWYNATEGTLFAQASLIFSSYSQGVLVDLGAGGAFGTTEYVNWSGMGWILNPNTPPINVSSSVATTPTAKVAAGLKTNDSVISANGLIGTTDTSCGIVAAPTTLSIGKAGWAAGNFFNGWIQRITYYPRRLSNAELQGITA